MSVNRPTDPKARDADIENKLRLYGIYNAFANGKVPSNKQIDVALNSALESKVLSTPSDKLSDEGKSLVNDLKTVINEAKLLLLTKNHDQAIQEFIWHAQQAATTTSGPAPNAPITKDQAKEDSQKGLAGLKTLGTLMMTNGQFRKLLSDASILLRDIASDAAQNAGGRLQPSQDQLSQIDHPAEDNTWHEAPDMNRNNLRERAKGAFNKNAPVNVEDVQKAAQEATSAAHPQGSQDPKDFGQLAVQERQGNKTGVDAQGGVNAALKSLDANKDDQKLEESKQKTKEKTDAYKARAQDYLRNKVPQERRDQTIYRLKKMVVEIQGHEDYQQAIDTLLYLAETYSGHSKSLTQQTNNTISTAHEDNHLKTSEKLLRTVLERFANNTSSEDLFESINDIYKDADRDPELKGWFRDINGYIRRCLKEQGYILGDAANEQYDELYDRGRFLLRDRYRAHTDRIVDEFKFLGDQFAQDPQSVQFGKSLQKLFDNLGTDENGKAVFKKHLVTDVFSVILPGFFENVRYIPVPRIEYSDKQFDAVIENLIVESDNLMPNVLELGNDSYFRWGRKNIESKNKQKLMLAVSGIQCDLKDVSFYIKKKQGFPSLTDTGLMDIFLGGDGFSFTIKMSTAEKSDRAHFFQVDKVDVQIKNMNIKLKQSKHKLLFSLFKPLLLRVMRPALQKVLEKQIKDSFSEFDRKLFAVKTEVDKVEADLKKNPDPEHASSIFQRYLTAAQKEFAQKKEKAKDAVADKTANIALTEETSIFKDIKLPGGTSTAATKYKNMAREGERWESPVFGLGSAKETSNIPKPSSVTRKPHGSGKAQLRTAPRDSGMDYDTTGINYGAPAGTNNYDGAPPARNYGAPPANYGAPPVNNFGAPPDTAYPNVPTHTGPYAPMPQTNKPEEYNPQLLGSNVRSTLGQ